MGIEKLSHTLLDLGFFCALGTTEHKGPGGYEVMVMPGKPMAWDLNNGVLAVYDEKGRPWIGYGADFRIEGVLKMQLSVWLGKTGPVNRGAYVPHSNDGGWFVQDVLPKIRELMTRSH